MLNLKMTRIVRPQTANQIILAVTAGVNWLDENYADWASKIKVQLFSVADPDFSPLAYVIGEGWDEMFTINEVRAHAFLLDYADPATVELANRMWLGEITRRLPSRVYHVAS